MKEIISSNELKTMPGLFSQGIKSNGLVFTSGQLPMDPETDTIELEDIKKATRFCLEAIEKIAIAAGSTKNDLVKVTILLCSEDFAKVYGEMNETYVEFFEGCDLPARTCFGVAQLPLNSKIEIEATIATK